jgi:16S rRNA (cytidine1402-2'-O)-methyltransferase
MALFIVATPIGNPEDISVNALKTLKSADLIIGEELKVLRQILKHAGIQAKPLDQLNEHSKPADIEFLLKECKTKRVALVSDCGTPGFCDPGSDLVKACHKNGVPVHPVPGASSLMALISVAGVRLDQFTFAGFLPAKTELRAVAWKSIVREPRPVILMETPYRCDKLMAELTAHVKNRLCVIGFNLTQAKEKIIRSKAKELPQMAPFGENEPIVLIMPETFRDD